LEEIKKGEFQIALLYENRFPIKELGNDILVILQEPLSIMNSDGCYIKPL